ncbi:uncharacterized protein NPIL_58761 [Nephila pilipes]|uniref:C2H2-type domain-containing protein n=1 Tax=Nephila pilipes TaxID=299642 RepID=A0A8X6PJZ5_NEPPI|nr:uncharacterized protein NPIL_58761 [Nephila pilipes]
MAGNNDFNSLENVPQIKKCNVILNRNFMDRLVYIKNDDVFIMKRLSTDSATQSDIARVSEKKRRKINSLSSDDLESESEIRHAANSSIGAKRRCNSLRENAFATGRFNSRKQNSDDEASPSEISDTASSASDIIRAFGKKKRRKINPILDDSKTQVRKLLCSKCKKTFNTHSSLLIHRRSHKKNKFKCVICKSAFPNRSSFINHMKKIHPETKPFVCAYPKCDKSFRTQKMLRDHEKSHYKYMCKFCKKSFIRKRDMHQHVVEIHL